MFLLQERMRPTFVMYWTVTLRCSLSLRAQFWEALA